MVHSIQSPRRIVIRANRETLMLVCAASAFTFAIAYGVHSRPAATPDTSVSAVPPQQDWAGHLAKVPQTTAALDTAPEVLTSDGLTVPKAQLALPQPALSMNAPKAKQRPCDPAVPCATKVVQPIRRSPPIIGAVPAAKVAAPEKEAGLLHTLNPLNHLPDVATMKRPFTYAGDTLSGWVKGL